MDYYGKKMSRLIEQLSALPGIGGKSAQRLAFHIIHMPKEQVEQLTDAIKDARENICYCKECYTLTDQELCPICANPQRDHHTIMVVESTRDLAAYEKTGKYDGVYHVLHGAISPMLGIGPADIRLKELMQRLQGDVNEVIIATNSSLEGETTAMYISKLIKHCKWRPGRRRSGVHRRDDTAACTGRACGAVIVRIYGYTKARWQPIRSRRNCSVSAAFVLLFADESPIIKIIDK